MPDHQPSKGIPIGAAIITQGIVYPELVDYDIGCGISFFKTGISVSILSLKKLEKLGANLTSIDYPWDQSMKEYQVFL